MLFKRSVRPKGGAQTGYGVEIAMLLDVLEAVGLDGTSTADNAPAYATAVSFNGTAGTVQAVPAPAKGHSTAFTAVSCLTGGRCLAAGETGKTTASTPAVMTGVLSGKAWKLDPGF